MFRANGDRRHQVGARFRQDNTERNDAVDAGVGRVESARDGVESHLAGNLRLELPLQSGDIYHEWAIVSRCQRTDTVIAMVDLSARMSRLGEALWQSSWRSTNIHRCV